MKKLFVSVPMRGRTEENVIKSVKTLHAIAEQMFGEPLEGIDRCIAHDWEKDTKEALCYLGESIKQLAEADCVIGVHTWNGNYPENNMLMWAAEAYGIPHVTVDAEKIACFEDICKPPMTGVTTNSMNG